MRVVVQRSLEASCKVDGKITGKIDHGLVLLVGFTEGDNLDKIKWMVHKIVNLRIFEDKNGVMNLSVLDTKGSILSISQFTLYANSEKGNRPSYIEAMKGDEATKLYDLFNRELKKEIDVQTGIFGSNMKIKFTNDGPVTILLER